MLTYYARIEDAHAFSQALKADPAKMAALEMEPEVGKIVLGDDIHAFIELMKSVFEVTVSSPSLSSPCPPPPTKRNAE